MTKHKLTPWFTGDVKPVHVGVYLCDDLDGFKLVYYRWGGDFWEFGGVENPEDVKKNSHKSFEQNKKWRGIQK